MVWCLSAANPPPSGTLSPLAWVTGVALVLAALSAHYVRPVSLGPLARPRPLAVATYGACVVGELALIALGSWALATVGHADLRPALIAAVVGLHFIPFAWAFGERMFFWLGGLVLVLGAVGLVAGAAGLARAVEASAVMAGLGMLVIITLYATGRFALVCPSDRRLGRTGPGTSRVCRCRIHPVSDGERPQNTLGFSADQFPDDHGGLVSPPDRAPAGAPAGIGLRASRSREALLAPVVA